LHGSIIPEFKARDKWGRSLDKIYMIRRQKAEGRRQRAEGRRQKAIELNANSLRIEVPC
jgi:hypothetical protein